MAYFYQVSFDIRPDQMNALEIGAALERVLDYLRTGLPGVPGYISARAMCSLNTPQKTRLVLQTEWETWDDLELHRRSGLAEDKVLEEFRPHVSPQGLSVHIYEELA